MKTYKIIFFFFLSSYCNYSQSIDVYNILQAPQTGTRCRAEVIDGDTVPVVDLDPVFICAPFVFKNQKQYEQWTRIKFNVKKVYPYAILAGVKLKEYDKALEKMGDERLKKAFIKQCERDLRKDFEEDLKAMTVTQGVILMKLIDREAGKTTYDIVKQLRGTFQAVMWQTLARLFGHNMKVEYDASGEDLMIERAIKLVENGQF